MRKIAAILVIGAMLAGCASNNARELTAPSVQGAASVERAGVKVTVDVYSDSDRQQQEFGEDLGSVGAIALHVLIDNKGEVPRLVDPAKMRLRLAGGFTMEPAFPGTVASLLHRPIGRSADYIGAAFGLLGALGVLAAAQSRQEALTERTEDYTRKELKRAVLAPGESSQGVLFYVVEPGTPKFSEATMVMTLSDAEGGHSENVEIAIRGITFPSFSSGSANSN